LSTSTVTDGCPENRDDIRLVIGAITPEKGNVSSPIVLVTILDGTAIINMLRPGTAKMFQDYATGVFVLYITSQRQHVTRLDIIWDVYMPESLKADTRSREVRGLEDVSIH